MNNLLVGEDGTKHWQPSLNNDWERLAHVNDDVVQNKDTISFMLYKTIPTEFFLLMQHFPVTIDH